MNNPRKVGPREGAQLRALLERANITQGAAAARCGVTLRTMQNWLAGATRIPQTAMNELIVMEGEQDAEQFERETGTQTPENARQVLELIASEQRRRIATLERDLEEERAALLATMTRIGLAQINGRPDAQDDHT